MSVSRDDFSIAFRSALLQRGGAQKFSVLSLIFLALVIDIECKLVDWSNLISEPSANPLHIVQGVICILGQ